MSWCFYNTQGEVNCSKEPNFPNNRNNYTENYWVTPEDQNAWKVWNNPNFKTISGANEWIEKGNEMPGKVEYFDQQAYISKDVIQGAWNPAFDNAAKLDHEFNNANGAWRPADEWEQKIKERRGKVEQFSPYYDSLNQQPSTWTPGFKPANEFQDKSKEYPGRSYFSQPGNIDINAQKASYNSDYDYNSIYKPSNEWGNETHSKVEYFDSPGRFTVDPEAPKQCSLLFDGTSVCYKRA